LVSALACSWAVGCWALSLEAASFARSLLPAAVGPSFCLAEIALQLCFSAGLSLISVAPSLLRLSRGPNFGPSFPPSQFCVQGMTDSSKGLSSAGPFAAFTVHCRIDCWSPLKLRLLPAPLGFGSNCFLEGFPVRCWRILTVALVWVPSVRITNPGCCAWLLLPLLHGCVLRFLEATTVAPIVCFQIWLQACLLCGVLSCHHLMLSIYDATSVATCLLPPARAFSFRSEWEAWSPLSYACYLQHVAL